MTMNVNKRKRPSDLDYVEFKQSIKIIKSDFTIKWLSDDTHSDHRLAKLFRRSDFFASDQLFQLGHCLRKIKSINRIWYDKVIGDIKTGEDSKIRADILEMLVAGMFHYPPDRIVVLPNSLTNKGWDILVKLNNGLDIYIQVKNNGETAKFQGDEETQYIKKLIIDNLQSRALRIMIFKIDNRYPDDLSWHHLKEELPTIMHSDFERNGIEIEGGWKILINDLNESLANLHPQRPSYILMLGTPLSKKEEGNLLGKITEACSVLGKKSEGDNENSLYIALVRVPIDASFNLCAKLASQYFEDSPKHRASGVLFYKCGLVTNTQKNEDSLGHVFHLVLRDGNIDLLKTRVSSLFEKIDIGIGRGRFSVEGINEYDIYNHLYMGNHEMRITDSHIDQSGQINYLFGIGKFKIDRYRGIEVHSFFIDSDRKEKEVDMDWMADDEPLLF